MGVKQRTVGARKVKCTERTVGQSRVVSRSRECEVQIKEDGCVDWAVGCNEENTGRKDKKTGVGNDSEL